MDSKVASANSKGIVGDAAAAEAPATAATSAEAL